MKVEPVEVRLSRDCTTEDWPWTVVSEALPRGLRLLRQAAKPEPLLVRGSGARDRPLARDEETRRLFLVEQTLEWVACASHIFIDFISL